jgi:hypothetical protein
MMNLWQFSCMQSHFSSRTLEMSEVLPYWAEAYVQHFSNALTDD